MVSKREKMRTSTNIRRWSGNCRLSSMLILYVLVLCSFYAYCEAREWIIDNGETLVSTGGKFEFGFFSPPGSSGNKRYVGIWYNVWDDNRTVVCVANRNFPVINAIGVFNVTEELGLKVLDTTGKEYWSADVSWLSCPCINQTLTLTDLGNLIFREIGQQTNLWNSCGTPTDTLLPGTDVNNGVTLISWRGSDDPGEGSLTFDIGPDGIKDRYSIYKGCNIYCKHFSSDEIEAKLKNLSEDFTARFVMDSSGKIEYWRWDVKSMNWSLIMAEPGNKCDLYNNYGNYGVCNPSNKLECNCLPGFKPNAPEKWHSGDFSNGCARNSMSCGENDMFFPVYAMSWDNNLKTVSVKDESACKTECLRARLVEEFKLSCL